MAGSTKEQFRIFYQWANVGLLKDRVGFCEGGGAVPYKDQTLDILPFDYDNRESPLMIEALLSDPTP